ncbi:MAG: C40 family peptidase [Ruminococcus flavefaciens]|nr:C40 family peptidase [Ruminococcus flavefaciens]
MKNKRAVICALAVAAASLSLALPACAAKSGRETEEEVTAEITQTEEIAAVPEEQEEAPAISVPPQPKTEKIKYVMPTADGVNLRSGAGTGYKSLGTAERNTLYALSGETNGWYKTKYKNGEAYISSKYCSVVQMEKSGNAKIESVIEEGCKCLGVKYVYGATRYHDGTGKRLGGFSAAAFDCSSLMQYIFKLGAGIDLQVNTRTQIYQGTTVNKGGLKRGDLLFFTNASRKNNKGIERVGHVALYLGDNYILHTASDYAKIEQISPSRWEYYIQAQRMI